MIMKDVQVRLKIGGGVKRSVIVYTSGSTRIASYLRRLMTKHWIKIHMKFDSAN